MEEGNREIEAEIRALKMAPQVRRRAAAEALLHAEEGSTIYRFEENEGASRHSLKPR